MQKWAPQNGWGSELFFKFDLCLSLSFPGFHGFSVFHGSSPTFPGFPEIFLPVTLPRFSQHGWSPVFNYLKFLGIESFRSSEPSCLSVLLGFGKMEEVRAGLTKLRRIWTWVRHILRNPAGSHQWFKSATVIEVVRTEGKNRTSWQVLSFVGCSMVSRRLKDKWKKTSHLL